MAPFSPLKPDVSPKTIASLKNKLLQPALTSHFAVKIVPKGPVIDFIGERIRGFTLSKLNELVLLCSEATLPGSSLFTHEVANDFPGVTEKMVYRRQYDDTSSFTFYVDHDYEIIEVFESWINYIVNEDSRDKFSSPNASYRMKFRDDYAGTIAIRKFERSMGAAINSGTNQPQLNDVSLEYDFINAFPVSIDSMPVSYEGSTILKCNVNFTYMRYVRSLYK
jgi:hypothetical protein